MRCWRRGNHESVRKLGLDKPRKTLYAEPQRHNHRVSIKHRYAGLIVATFALARILAGSHEGAHLRSGKLQKGLRSPLS